MEAKHVVVAISDPALARVMIFWLRDTLSGQAVVSAGETTLRRGDVVLATPSDCDPLAAAEFAARGIQPVILTPIPRNDELHRYARAGARYLAMSIDNSQSLSDAITAALEDQRPTMAARAELSHAGSPRSA